MDPTTEKPICELIGQDGNAFGVIAAVCRALKQAGMPDRAKQLQSEAFAAESYHALLALVNEYVEVV